MDCCPLGSLCSAVSDPLGLPWDSVGCHCRTRPLPGSPSLRLGGSQLPQRTGGGGLPALCCNPPLRLSAVGHLCHRGRGEEGPQCSPSPPPPPAANRQQSSSLFPRSPHLRHLQERLSPLFNVTVRFDRLQHPHWVMGFIYSFLLLLLFCWIFILYFYPPVWVKAFPSNTCGPEYRILLPLGWVFPLDSGNVSIGEEGKGLVQHEEAKYTEMFRPALRFKVINLKTT